MFGPSSLESEDNILRLDRTLADLFRYVDEKVGLEHTLIVLSADHGAPEAPEYMASLGMDVGRITPKKIDIAPTIAALKDRFGIGRRVDHPLLSSLHLSQPRSHSGHKGLDQAEVERALAEELMKFDGIAAAVPSSDLLKGDLPDTPAHSADSTEFSSETFGRYLSGTRTVLVSLFG